AKFVHAKFVHAIYVYAIYVYAIYVHAIYVQGGRQHYWRRNPWRRRHQGRFLEGRRLMLRRHPRTGFTLLEMILALSIGLVLLGALYMTMNGQLFQAQAGRDVVEEGTLARSILTRL